MGPLGSVGGGRICDCVVVVDVCCVVQVGRFVSSTKVFVCGCSWDSLTVVFIGDGYKK